MESGEGVGEKSSTVHEVQMQKRLSMQMYSSELALALKKSIGYKLQVWSIWSHSTISGKKKKKKTIPAKAPIESLGIRVFTRK